MSAGSEKTTAELKERSALKLPKSARGEDRLAENISRLEYDLESERDGRREERFIWICALVVAFDAIIVPQVGFAFTGIFLFEIVVLVFLAEHLGVDRAVQLMSWLAARLARKTDDP